MALRIGRYLLHDEIASGGMASVHFGRLVGTGGFAKTVAIKRLLKKLVRETAFRTMILEEARLASRIRHPNVVPPLDVLGENGELLLVMEYVHGEALSKLMRAARAAGERVPVAVACAILSNVLHGLHAAHEARGETGEPLEIVHRDVSPQNVIVGVDGVARVIDFGIAKAVTSETTNTGMVKGKLPYLSPEQLEGEPVTRRTDLYAAGIVLWEVLTGRRLYEGADDSAILRKILAYEPPPPSHQNPTVPAALDEIILKSLAKKPADRYATAREMALAIEEAVAIATPSVVGAWAERLAEETLSKRAALIAKLEATPPELDEAEAEAAPVSRAPVSRGPASVPPPPSRGPASVPPPPSRAPAPLPNPPLPPPPSRRPSLVDAAVPVPPPPSRRPGSMPGFAESPPSTPRPASVPNPARISAPEYGFEAPVATTAPMPPTPLVTGDILVDTGVHGQTRPLPPPHDYVDEVTPAFAPGQPQRTIGATLPLQTAPDPEDAGRKPWVLFLGGALLVFLAVATPTILARVYVALAARQGILLTLDRVEVSRRSLRLVDVHVSTAELPGAALHARSLTLGGFFSPKSITVEDAVLELDGRASEMWPRILAFRAARGAALDERFASVERVNMNAGRVVWKDAVADGAVVQAENVTLEAVRTAGRPLFDDAQVTLPLVSLRTGNDLLAGPWLVEVERKPPLTRVLLRFDTQGSYVGRVSWSFSDDGAATVSFAVPPASIEELRVPPAVFGGVTTKDTRVELAGEVSLVSAAAPTAAALAIDTRTPGFRAASGRFVLVIARATPFASGAPIDLALDVPVTGDPARPLAIAATMSFGPTDPNGRRATTSATARLTGTLDTTATVPRLTLRGTTSGLPCERAAAQQTALALESDVLFDQLRGSTFSLTPTVPCTPKLR